MIYVLGLSVLVLLNSFRLSRLTLVFISPLLFKCCNSERQRVAFVRQRGAGGLTGSVQMGFLELFFRIIAM